ncbi:MAG: hypothetical protein WCP21_20180, partial [Armatimonadota bacterium]
IVSGLASLVKAQSTSNTPDLVINTIRAACDNIDLKNPANIGKMGAGRINTANSVKDMPPAPARSVMAFDTPGDSGGSITVSWSLSADDGRGFGDVTRYDVLRSDTDTGPFAVIGTVDKGTKGYLDLVGSANDYIDYWYEVVAYDKVNSTVSKIAGPAAARDDTPPPAVTVTAKDTMDAGVGGSISLEWSTYVPTSDFREYHIYRSTSSFTDVIDMTPLAIINTNTTKTYQDKTTIDNTDYYYAVTSLDNSKPNNELKEVTAFGPVRSNPNYAFGFPPGLSLISIGLTLPDNNLDKIFDLTQGLQLSRWEPASLTSGAYHAYQAGSTDTWLLQSPGRGFWLRGTLPVALNLSGAAATTDVKTDFLAGWNQLGNPYAEDVEISAATVKIGGGTPVSLDASNTQGSTRNYAWAYDNAQNSYKLISPSLPFSTTTVKKGAGFFFLATRPGQLIIPNPKASAPAQVATASKPASVDWALRLCASTEGVADTDNFLGVSADLAKADAVASPPPARDGFDFYFSANGARTATAFVKSLASGDKWQATLACSRPSAAVKLSWPDLTGLPRDCRPILRDLRSGKSVYMRTANGYSFTLGRNET